MQARHPVQLTRHYKKESPLFVQGEPCKGSFVVLHGMVVFSTGNGSRQQIRVASAERDAVIGLSEAIGGSPYYTTAIAETDTTVHFLPKEDVLRLIEDDPAAALHVVQMLAGNLSQLYDRIKRIPIRE
jgi:CRP-like cAMP-binding protein